ncbi:hypothetical protein GCK72_022505 [Caenorhabditis remanei]|uniref:Uncharacterized protein n=1 Tax=Caenorhabditis remanei TaxID=31234 RepID=A0A6A5FU34_CAERE|nr:hypothetical protein GCK72_022505 [Caenorhabditis remanei]KAF1746054.1 hypothetical protein GCK72_022505 [Caenorhabditis remanei]
MEMSPQQKPENAQLQFLADYFMRANYSPRWINGVDVTGQNQFPVYNVRNQGVQHCPMIAHQAHPYHVAPSLRRGIPVSRPVYFYPRYMYLNTTRPRLFITHQFDTSKTLPTRRCMYRQGASDWDWHYQVSLTGKYCRKTSGISGTSTFKI